MVKCLESLLDIHLAELDVVGVCVGLAKEIADPRKGRKKKQTSFYELLFDFYMSYTKTEDFDVMPSCAINVDDSIVDFPTRNPERTISKLLACPGLD